MKAEDYTYSKDGDFRGWVDIDHFADDPREWDNLGTMVCFHNKYRLGDSTDFKANDYESWNELHDAIKANGGVLILPLGIYDHGGITMYVGTKVDSWDSGQVGFIYCTEKDLEREGLSKERAEEILRGEVKTYDAYLTGNVYVWGVEQRVSACSCGECKEWEAVETNGGYTDHKEAMKDMNGCLSNFEPKLQEVN